QTIVVLAAGFNPAATRVPQAPPCGAWGHHFVNPNSRKVSRAAHARPDERKPWGFPLIPRSAGFGAAGATSSWRFPPAGPRPRGRDPTALLPCSTRAIAA